MRYEIAIRYFVHDTQREDVRERASTVASSGGTSSKSSRRFFSDDERNLLKDVFKVNIQAGIHTKNIIRTTLRQRRDVLRALPGVPSDAIEPSCFIVEKVSEVLCEDQEKNASKCQSN